MARPARNDAEKPATDRKAKPRAARPKRGAKPGKHCFATKAGTGTSLHAELADGRSIWARRQAEVFNNIVSDLGGRSEQSELSMQMIRRAIGLTVICEKAEIALAENKELSIGEYVLAVNAFGRVAGALGLSRKPREVMSLETYLARKAAERPPEAEEPDANEEAADG